MARSGAQRPTYAAPSSGDDGSTHAAHADPETRTRNELHDQASTRRLAGAIVGVSDLALTATSTCSPRGRIMAIVRPPHPLISASPVAAASCFGRF